MKRTRIRIGDIFEIPLSDGRKAFGQYVFRDEKNGPLIQVFDLVTEDEIQLGQLNEISPLFPPVFTGLFAAIRTGLWKVIGHMPVEGFVYPKFISPLFDSKAGEARTWYLWNGKEYIRLGRKLPEEYKQLEQLVGWDPHDIAHRIETGENSLDYRLER